MADLLSHRDSSSKKSFRIRMSTSWIVPVFYLTLAIFFITLASYGGLLLLNRAQEDAHEELRLQIEDKKEDLRARGLNQIFALNAQLKNLRTVLSRHLFSTNAFNLIEQTTHPQVQFLNFAFVEGSKKISMSGLAAEYRTVAEQIGLFQRSPFVEYVEFGGLSSGTQGVVSFNVSVTFTSKLLEFRQ